MTKLLRGPVLGTLMGFLFAANTLIWCWPLYFMVLIKLLMPTAPLRHRMGHYAAQITQCWVSCNSFFANQLLDIQWTISLPSDLKPDGQYLVCSNHQTWNDIFVVMRVFGRKIPFFRFFIKQELIWVPVLGLAWWGLDYPFMKRYKRSHLEKNPHLRGKDMETTRKACEKFISIPVAILNFVEGTRFTPAKHASQSSPYRHLLKPKAGGFAFALSAMGKQLDSVLDVTIVYPEGAKTFWDFLSGRVTQVIVEVRSLPVPQDFIGGDYEGDQAFRIRANTWVSSLWADKDKRIGEILAGAPLSSPLGIGERPF